MTPNIENITKWRDELLTTAAEQGRGQLRDADDRFCCLGIACEVAIKNGVPLVVEPAHEEGHYYYYYYRGPEEVESSDIVLPPIVSAWLGLSANPVLGDSSAAGLNDNDELSFVEIAKEIEKEFLNV